MLKDLINFKKEKFYRVTEKELPDKLCVYYVLMTIRSLLRRQEETRTQNRKQEI